MRILLADGQEKVRFALRVLLEHQSGLEVVGEATRMVDLLETVGTICPDLVLLAWDLPGRDATHGLGSLRERCPTTAIVALSGQPDAREAAMAEGADGFVSKGDPPEQLLAAIAACGGGASPPR